MPSGPFSKTITFTQFKVSNPDTGDGAFCRVYYRPSTWWRSGNRQRHADDPLPYTMRMGSTDVTAGLNQTCDAGSDLYYTTLTDGRWINLNNLVSNRAAANFVEKAQGSAQAGFGETLGEWRSSLDMMASRLTQLATAARQLRKGNFVSAARTLNLTKEQLGGSSLKRVKSFGNAWLELHLGWAPLVSDIYAAHEAITRDLVPVRVRGGARASDNYRTSQYFTTSRHFKKAVYTVGYSVRGDVRIVNPNVALAASLGLVNPASVAWALVPYSFVVDWFVNISELIGMYDGLLGCEVTKTSYTTLRNSQTSQWSEVRKTTPDGLQYYWVLNTSVDGHGAYCNRVLGLPPVHLTFPTSPRMSWQRGATAVALLLKYLR